MFFLHPLWLLWVVFRYDWYPYQRYKGGGWLEKFQMLIKSPTTKSCKPSQFDILSSSGNNRQSCTNKKRIKIKIILCFHFPLSNCFVTGGGWSGKVDFSWVKLAALIPSLFPPLLRVSIWSILLVTNFLFFFIEEWSRFLSPICVRVSLSGN